MTNLDVYPAALLLLGFVVGIVSGLLGLGGGWLITPVLNIMGFPVAIAVGTGLTQMVGTSAFAAFRHRGRGNVMAKLGLALSGPVICGVVLGRLMMNLMTSQGIAEVVIRLLYIALLGSLGLSIFIESRKCASTRRKSWLASLPRLGPVFVLDCEKQIAWSHILIVGLLAGIASGMLGVGGGFILMPFLVYGAGVETVVAVGTSLVPVVAGSIVGSSFYLQADQVELGVALLLFLGAVSGTYLGVAATAFIDGRLIRKIFGGLLLSTAFSVLLKQLHFPKASLVLVYASATFLVIAFGVLFIKGIAAKRLADKAT